MDNTVTNPVISAVTGCLTDIMTWFSSSIGSMTNVFYSNSGLTFFGVLAVCGLGVAVALLLLNIIKGFLRFR